MTVTTERFQSGMTYDEYKAQLTRNRERFLENERTLALSPDDLAAFTELVQPLRVLVLTEDWCGDVIANLPVLGRLAEASGKLDLRVFLRDQNPDLMDLYLNQGRFRSIPVFVFFDEGMNEVGRFIERPAAVSELRERKRQQIHAEHPEWGGPETPFDQLSEEARAGVMDAMAALRAETREFSNAEVVRELRAIVARAKDR